MNRRNFLKQFGALAASGLILPETVKASGFQVIIPAQGVVPSSVSAKPTGPGFTQAYFTLKNSDVAKKSYGFAPFLGSYNQAFSVDINLGQNPFAGNPGGFSPYDPGFSGKWNGVAPSGNSVYFPAYYYNKYSLAKSSGKYYWEITWTSATVPYHFDVGITAMPGSYSYNSYPLDSYQALFCTGYGYPNQAFLDKYNGGMPWGWNVGNANTAIKQGDTVGVWMDLDNDLLCIQKIGTKQSDYVQTVAYPPAGAI